LSVVSCKDAFDLLSPRLTKAAVGVVLVFHSWSLGMEAKTEESKRLLQDIVLVSFSRTMKSRLITIALDASFQRD
jgi:hypothetical protein